MFTNPGAVPKDAMPLPQDVDKARMHGKTPRKCQRSGIYKPSRAHFDSGVQRNVIKMDHHCPWVLRPWFMDHDPRTMDHSPCSMDHAAWTMVHGPINHIPWSMGIVISMLKEKIFMPRHLFFPVDLISQRSTLTSINRGER